ncbi:MAG: YicC/YloC family endoribonuclease, partial [Desulfuromonadales bacterium]|nr:YicC/YloC family endoribonuclease [Desulfuromonadales bacterium]
MIRSMTGFGKGIATIDGATLTVEIKTVNHRFCDISVKSPRLFSACETELRRRLSERLKRGKVDLLVLLEYTSGGAALPVLNLPLAQAYYQAFSELRTTLN